MVRNVIIAGLAVAAAALGYQYQQVTKTVDQQALLMVEMRDKAEKELQILRERLATEERGRQVRRRTRRPSQPSSRRSRPRATRPSDPRKRRTSVSAKCRMR